MRVGVFSPNDPRPWVREENIDQMLQRERVLVERLVSAGLEVIRGGEGLPKLDQIAWSTRLVHKHIGRIAAERPDALIINQGSWTFPYDSVDAIKVMEAQTGDTVLVLLFSHKDPKVPGLVAGMATGGALQRIGIPYQHVYGDIERDPRVLKRLLAVLKFYERRRHVSEDAKTAINRLRGQKYLALGGMSLRMPTTTADVDQWEKLFGISYEALDQSELLSRAQRMVDWSGKPGESEFRVLDQRLDRAADYVRSHGKIDYSREKLRSFSKLLYQLSLYYAALDLVDAYDVTFGGIKCQDELSSRECTACLMAAYLNNDISPDGKKKRIVPVACENDMDSALTQLILHLLTGQPSGFGDFRDVEKGILTIMNCGQHPPFFFGGPEMDSESKLDSVEYMGQEIFYAAGGSSVRGRTPGGLRMTIARLGRQNLLYRLVAAAVETINVEPDEHEKYNASWPLIRARIPMADEELIAVWPCNHLAFAYGDLTPQLANVADRLGIGYSIYDAEGTLYYKPT